MHSTRISCFLMAAALVAVSLPSTGCIGSRLTKSASNLSFSRPRLMSWGKDDKKLASRPTPPASSIPPTGSRALASSGAASQPFPAQPAGSGGRSPNNYSSTGAAGNYASTGVGGSYGQGAGGGSAGDNAQRGFYGNEYGSQASPSGGRYADTASTSPPGGYGGGQSYNSGQNSYGSTNNGGGSYNGGAYGSQPTQTAVADRRGAYGDAYASQAGGSTGGDSRYVTPSNGGSGYQNPAGGGYSDQYDGGAPSDNYGGDNYDAGGAGRSRFSGGDSYGDQYQTQPQSGGSSYGGASTGASGGSSYGGSSTGASAPASGGSWYPGSSKPYNAQPLAPPTGSSYGGGSSYGSGGY